MARGRVFPWIVALGALFGCAREYTIGGGGTAESGSTDGCTLCGEACVDLEEDERHCGSCGNVCAEEETCREGVCVGGCEVSCEEGTEICEGTECRCRSGYTTCEGRCVNLQTSPEHCGACGVVCAQACGAGACVDASCPGFVLSCDGACVDPMSDPEHCGGCGERCGPEEQCDAGICGS